MEAEDFALSFLSFWALLPYICLSRQSMEYSDFCSRMRSLRGAEILMDDMYLNDERWMEFTNLRPPTHAGKANSSSSK